MKIYKFFFIVSGYNLVEVMRGQRIQLNHAVFIWPNQQKQGLFQLNKDFVYELKQFNSILENVCSGLVKA